MKIPRVRLEVDFGSRSSIGEISLIAFGYGIHQAWIYGSMYDNGSIFAIPPSVSGFFNEAISLTYMVSILVYGIILLIAAAHDKQALRMVYNPTAITVSGILCSVGTFLLLAGFDEPGARQGIEVVSGLLTGIGSSNLLLAWGVAFSRRDTSTIAINGALAIIIGFAVYACILHALPYPFGGIVSGLIPLVEVLILLTLQRVHAINEINSPMNVGLPIDRGRFALIFGLPVLFLGFALGIMRQFSISTVLDGASCSDQSFIFMTACFATIFLLMVFLGPERESGYGSFFRPLIPFIAITVLFIPFASDSDSTIATGILLMGYMIFEAMMWVFFGQLSQRFRLSPVLVFGLGRGIMSMSSLGGSLLPIAGSSIVTSTPFGSGVVILILIIVMMFAFSLLPSEKTILSLTTFSRKTEDAIRSIDASIAEADGGFAAAATAATQTASPDYVEMGSEIHQVSLDDEVKHLAANVIAKTEDAPRNTREAGADDDDAPRSGTGAFRQRCENVANTFLLSKREAEVMFYLARGFKSSNIQEILYISEGTAKTHIRHIYRKLDVHSQSELMRLVNSVEL